MSDGEAVQSAGWRLTLAGVALGVAIFAVVWFIAAALGTKFGLWGWQFGLGTMTIGWGPKIAFVAVGLSVVAILAGIIKAPRTKPVILGLAALLVSSMVLFRLVGFGAQAGPADFARGRVDRGLVAKAIFNNAIKQFSGAVQAVRMGQFGPVKTEFGPVGRRGQALAREGINMPAGVHRHDVLPDVSDS